MLALAATRSHAACLAPGVEPTPAAVVDAQFAYYNAHDVEAFASCYAENVEMAYLDGSQPPIRSRAGILAGFAFLKTMPREMGVQIVQRTLTGPHGNRQGACRWVALGQGPTRYGSDLRGTRRLHRESLVSAKSLVG
jgi:hypothetical protein